MEIAGRTILLTGATGGLGQAIARRLAADGAHLVLTGRRVEVLEPLAAELGARLIAADLSDPDAPEHLVSRAGELHGLVANAALPASGTIDEYTPEQIDRALTVNLRAPILLGRRIGYDLARRGDGALVFISSLSGKAGAPGSALYAATKFGLRGFALSLREDLRASGVSVTSVFPGFIRGAGMFADAGVRLPRGVGTKTPEDVATAVARGLRTGPAEIDVAPVGLRLGAAAAAVAPGLASAVTRRLGGDALSGALADAQRDRR